MATHAFVNIGLKEASYLADLTGIEHDLQSTIRLCQKLLEIRNLTADDVEAIDILSIAIAVRYSRSFVSGVRKKLDVSKIEAIDEKLLAEHEKVLAIRNKHIAHSVNAFEENQVVGYYILENPKEKGITSISVQHGHIVGLNHGDAVSVIQLSNLVLEYVNKEITNEKEKLLELVRKQDINELLNSASKKVLMSGNADPRKRRK